jgi:hypothetical protein
MVTEERQDVNFIKNMDIARKTGAIPVAGCYVC